MLYLLGQVHENRQARHQDTDSLVRLSILHKLLQVGTKVTHFISLLSDHLPKREVFFTISAVSSPVFASFYSQNYESGDQFFSHCHSNMQVPNITVSVVNSRLTQTGLAPILLFLLKYDQDFQVLTTCL